MIDYQKKYNNFNLFITIKLQNTYSISISFHKQLLLQYFSRSSAIIVYVAIFNIVFLGMSYHRWSLHIRSENYSHRRREAAQMRFPSAVAAGSEHALRGVRRNFLARSSTTYFLFHLIFETFNLKLNFLKLDFKSVGCRDELMNEWS